MGCILSDLEMQGSCNEERHGLLVGLRDPSACLRSYEGYESNKGLLFDN